MGVLNMRTNTFGNFLRVGPFSQRQRTIFPRITDPLNLPLPFEIFFLVVVVRVQGVVRREEKIPQAKRHAVATQGAAPMVRECIQI